MGTWANSKMFVCLCCKPGRQIYYQANGAVDVAYHESDNTKAKGGTGRLRITQ